MLRQGHRVWEMTELHDVYDGVLCINEIEFRGDGMTEGERLTLVDGNGDLVAEHTISNATENATLIGERTSIRGLRVSQMPNGSVSVMVRIR
jgi:hypothetical protein